MGRSASGAPPTFKSFTTAFSEPEQAGPIFCRLRLIGETVSKERRKSPRRVINRVAQFYTGLGALPRSCTISDISAGGARIYCEHPMPDTFTLAVTGDGVDERRACQVVWRLGAEIGVSFTDRSR